MQDLNQKIKQNTKYIFIQNLITPAINLFIGIYIIKKLSITEYGIYNLLYALIGYITLVSSMGVLNAFQRFIPEYSNKKEYSKVKALFNHGLLLRFILAALVIAVLLIFGNQLSRLFKVDNFHEYVQFFVIGIILFLEVQVVEVTLTSLLLNRSIMFSYLITTIVRAGLIYFFLERHPGLKGLLLAETFYYGLSFLMQLIFYYANFSSHHPAAAKNLPLKRLLRYSGFSYLDEIGWTILDVKTDFFVISAFLGPTMVGLYGFANQFMESVSKVLPFKILRPLIRSVFFLKFSENGDKQQLNRHFNFLVKIIAFISFPFFMSVIVFGDKMIVHLFDVKYLPALNLLWVFAGFMMIVSFQLPLQLVVQAVEKVEINFYSNIFSLYNLIGDLLVVQAFGVMGVAIVTCTARLFQFVFVWHRIRKFVPLTFDLKSLLKILINSIIMMIVLFLARNLISDVITLIVFWMLGWIIYFVLSFFNRSFFVEERDVINKLLPRPIFVF